MTPMFSLPLVEGDQDDQTHCNNILAPTRDASSSTCTILFGNPQDQDAKDGGDHHHHYHHHHLQQHGPSSCDQTPFSCNSGDPHRSVQWMSSKMRLMRKMMNSDRIVVKKTRSRDQQQPNHDHSTTNNNSIIRICSDCNTTKTPLWRSGPRGPKSLCNACGIRQRKARRAMAAAAAANGGAIPAADVQCKGRKGRRSDADMRTMPFKKRLKMANGAAAAAAETGDQMKKLCFDEVMISWSKDSAFHAVFPQDETEAAILLMALSCGLIHG